MILLDTHTLLWLDTADRRLGRKTRALVEQQWSGNRVAVSAISFWEAGMLTARGRFRPAVPIAQWRLDWLNAGLIEFPLDGAVMLRSLDFASLPDDPADRFIAATALRAEATLITADERLLSWPHALERHDARS